MYLYASCFKNACVLDDDECASFFLSFRNPGFPSAVSTLSACNYNIQKAASGKRANPQIFGYYYT